jgi:hypothetical protein
LNYESYELFQELNIPSKIHFHTYSSVFEKSNRSINLPDSLDWRNKDVITPVISIAHAPIVSQVVAVGENFSNNHMNIFFLKILNYFRTCRESSRYKNEKSRTRKL